MAGAEWHGKSAEIADTPVLPIKELEAISEERVSERIVEQSVNVFVPQMRRKIAEVVQLVQTHATC